MRHRRPDHRLNWRDSNMPVIRDYRMDDGTTRTVIGPDYERRYREMLMQTTAHASWRDDPTYNMAKSNAKRHR